MGCPSDTRHPVFFTAYELLSAFQTGGNKILAAVYMRYAFGLTLLFISTTMYGAGPRKPTITGQYPVAILEDHSYTIQLTDLKVVDPDDFFYPFGFTLTVYEGENYTVNGHTVTPVANFFGQLKVPVTVNDGTSNSNKYDFIITVNPVNDPPVITGQQDLSTEEDTAITLQLSHLTVNDPDNSYPADFRLTVNSGSNYSVSGTTVTPANSFTGTLSVPVTVNDGSASSPVYNLSITVIPGNKRPVITGQNALSTAKNKSLDVQLTDLKVDDPDSAFPGDFTMIIYSGQDYTYSETRITPATNFTGTLIVKVAVNDGFSTSDVFDLRIEVKDELTITGQKPLEINEDEKTTLTLSMLEVYDPNNQYPQGYLLRVAASEHYSVKGTEIQPRQDFSGVLTVGVQVTNGTYTSPSFNFKITVKPVNDPPQLEEFNTAPLRYSIGNGATKVYSSLRIIDPDDTHLILAEVGLRGTGYQPGSEVLVFSGTENIKGVFDSASGVLTLIGQATHAEYQQALALVEYDYTNLETPQPANKTLYVKLNDGKDVSVAYEREIAMVENVELDIPTVFSPNDDAANDTWKIKPLRQSERYNSAIVRVYNSRGLLVFETSGFQKEWDGRFGGTVLPAGTYFYTIDLNLNYNSSRITGAVTLLK
jgi:gliding motility-associated-like protein